MRLLLVEDEQKLANALKQALELRNYTVDVAYDGELGLDLATSEHYDLVILDLMLPKITGFTICQQLRADHINTPILILTAKGQVADKVTGLDCGADDYMVKPFALTELFARVRALTRRSPTVTQPLLKVQNLTLDPVSFKVSRAGTSISLSAKEFALLEYLLRHKGVVVSREQLVNHVWPYDSAILPTTVEVHIKHLRDKLNLPGQSPLIQTVRGFGYELSD